MAITVTEKRCVGCGEVKPVASFHRNPQAKDGRHTRCAPCKNAYAKGRYQAWTQEQRDRHKERVVRCRYGVKADVIRAMYDRQGGCCAICAAPGMRPLDSSSARDEVLHIDHDHATGRIRGLLCSPCNKGLGNFRDAPATLVRAAAYLMTEGGQ